MAKRLWNLAMALVVALSFAGSVFADEIRGTISKADRREITVKTKDGKETTVAVSGSRTQFEGGSRDDLKEGMRVRVEEEGGEAKKITISK